MESYYAHIEDNIVTFVEVVTDDFFDSNPQRYLGLWLKVGEGSKKPFCGIGDIYLSEKDKIIPQKPYPSWLLDIRDEWVAPKLKPEGNYYWDEKTLNWIQY